MAMSVSPKECHICNEDYDEGERCPRILSCSHTLCSCCIENLIATNRSRCPFCRRRFSAQSSQEVTVNHIALDLIRYFEIEDSAFTSRIDKVKRMKKEALVASSLNTAICQEAQKQMQQTVVVVESLENVITDENARIENELIPKLQHIVFQNNRTQEELMATKVQLQKHIKDIHRKKDSLDEVTQKVKTSTAVTFKEVSEVLDEVEEVNMAISNWIQNFQELISEEEKSLAIRKQKAARDMEKTNIILDLLSIAENCEDGSISVPCMGAMALLEENFAEQITVENLLALTPSVKYLIAKERLYAVQRCKRKSRYARISLSRDQKLLLHRLTEGSLPLNVHLLEFYDVMASVNTSSTLTFIEFATCSNVFGKFYIRLVPDTKRTENFIYLCTGEKGPSYSSSKLLDVEQKGYCGERLFLGDYENLSGKGGKTLVRGAGWEEGGILERARSAGALEGVYGDESRTAQFSIYTKDNPMHMMDLCFGNVEEGLDVITEVISDYSDVGNVVVSDCGVVLKSFKWK